MAGGVRRAAFVDTSRLYRDGVLQRDVFADEVWDVVRNACEWQAFVQPLPEVSVDDLIGESWLWILKRWESVESAKKPVGMAVYISRLACYAIQTKVTGRPVCMRGKMSRFKGYRDEPGYGVFLEGDREGENPGMLGVVRKPRRCRELDVLERVSMWDELERAGQSEALRSLQGCCE